ncbi:MAG: hypothetical protein LQ348_003197 [Seirophora lacunosa]|nr:MAG: hypothetical protein LQ344_002056 [Seirophora lacunosa]KAI4192327.1 MAG: hypothetical protein LQ348_003197 [Seirophora lacunosa]
MSLAVPKRPVINLLFLYPSFAQSSVPAVRRHESSARRTTKRLRVKPDPSSFAPPVTADQLQQNVVFNPPSSSPSPYHTPAVFLPRSDPRRSLLAQAHDHANPYAQPNKRLPPPTKKSVEKRYHLKEEEIAEIRRLRLEDPFTWSRKKLAQKFDCSDFFVAMICEASPERKKQQQRALDEIKARWGNRRRHAREDRQKRRILWGRDE